MVTIFESEEFRNWIDIAMIKPENKKDKFAVARTRNNFWIFTKGRTGRFANTALLPSELMSLIIVAKALLRNK